MKHRMDWVGGMALVLVAAVLVCRAAAPAADGGGRGDKRDDGTDAKSDAPRSPRAAAARRQYDESAARARQAYLRALIDADRQLIADLDAAFDAAMSGKALDEANRIDRARKEAAVAMKQHQAQLARGGADVPTAAAAGGGDRTFTIRADRPWQPTVEVRKGQRVTMAARGTWCAWVGRRKDTTFGPGGLPGSGDHYGALQARIGPDGPPFFPAASYQLTADRDGVLSMEMADKAKEDNDGSLEVTITPGE